MNCLNSNRFWCCIRTFKWVPVLAVLIALSWSFYVFTFRFCFDPEKNKYEQSVTFVIYLFFLVMLLWTFLRTCNTQKLPVPKEFYLPKATYELLVTTDSSKTAFQVLEDFAKNLPVHMMNWNGSIRYCNKCKCVKPDRCHHCSICNTCILRMDHHCPWINECVNYANYKYFLLFLTYGQFYCTYLVIMLFPICWDCKLSDSYTQKNIHEILLLFLASLFEISLLTLFLYHCFLVRHNMTTLENLRKPIYMRSSRGQSYDLGWGDNIREIFGDRFILWPFPVFTTKGDGVNFPLRTMNDNIV